eukprot:snap_masked-scaffold_4-processed-gene-7.41-mRNA-1 protein AED:1.00 eAED:1.00 QI:0/-1/0/0/-1/1/1/0/67
MDLIRSKFEYLRGVDDIRIFGRVYPKLSWSDRLGGIMKLENQVVNKDDEINIQNTVSKQVAVIIKEL